MFTSDGWDKLYAGVSAEVVPTSGGVMAKPVHVHNRPTDSFGEYFEGEGEIFVIFKVGDKYYRKNGYESSYGDRTWDGDVVEVHPKTKTIQVWE